MNRSEALKLLCGGKEGVAIWNRRKPDLSPTFDLSEALLNGADLSGVDLSGTNLCRADLTMAVLYGADLSNADLRGAQLRLANLCEADLREADLRGADLYWAYVDKKTVISDKWRMVWEILNRPTAGRDLHGADLSEADLSNADLSGADLSGAVLRGAGLSGANFTGADLTRASLREANLSEADLRGADLSEAKLRGANLRGAALSRAVLSGADLREADLRETELNEANFSRAGLREAGLSGANLSGANLSGADLREAELCEANLHGADLSEAKLRAADLSGARLSRATLSGANLSEADLRGADLSEAKLRGANLRGAALSRAVLSGASLNEAECCEAAIRGADLRGADLRRTDLSRADLTEAKLVRCQLEDALFEGTIVTDCHVAESVGRPKAPDVLHLNDGRTLTGEDARAFLSPPSTVEVYLTKILSDRELGAYRFHLGEMRDQKIGPGVYLTGEREEAGGTVLRFQAPNYADIYDILPLLLKPFRMGGAIDWGQTYQALPEHDRERAVTTLARITAEDAEGRWVVADRLASVFGNFPNAKIAYLRDGRNLGLKIEVATNKAMYRKLAQENQSARAKSVPGRGPQLQLTVNGTANFSGDDFSMNNETNAGRDIVNSATAPNARARARDISLFNSEVENSGLDAELAKVLVSARKAIEDGPLKGADKDDAVDDLGKIAEEVKKAEPDAGRVKRLWEGLVKLTPDVAKMLEAAAKIGGMIHGGSGAS